ncbi:MAG: M20/M25/M40 family metallo-hydrolase [Candidatus Bathyarchaeia archaeon]
MKYIMDYLKELGYDAYTEGLNVLVSPEKDFLVASHVDTFRVISPFRFDGEYAYGTGVCDAKGSIVAILLALSTISSLNFGVAFFYDEEIGGKGSEIFSQRYKPKKAIVMEPTNLTIANVHYGGLEVFLEVSGISSHGSCPDKGENAIEKCIELIGTMRKLNKAKISTQFIMGGNREDYVIPDHCIARVNFQFAPSIKVEELLGEVNAICQGRAKVTVKECFNGFISGETTNILVKALKAAGLKVAFSEMPSWTDAINLYHLAACDAVVFGPGELSQCHTKNECIRLKDIEDAARVLIELNKAV